MVIDELFKIIEDRKNRLPKDSYVAALLKEGEDRIVQKVGEETVEVIIAAKGEDKDKIISEMADLWFHSLVLLALFNFTPEEVFKELENRRNEKK